MQVNSVLENINPLVIRMEAFKRGLFDFVTVRGGKKHYKQEQALKILIDNETEEFMYGGAAGGAKSWTGCVWLAFMSMIYPDTRWFIGRKELKRITESTLITFFKVAKEYGFQDDFKFNAQKNFIKFRNGSRIDLLELKYLPSDPMYERFGSTEYTGGWIEEAAECNFGAFDVLNTRVGRNLNDNYNITAKILLTANPNKNWVKKEFYDKHLKKEIGKLRKFLQALVTENPFIESGYIDRLKRTKDKAKKQRLLKGNWDYADDPNDLCSYDDIVAVFSNDHVESGQKYLTADIARLGSDKAIIKVWEGWKVIDKKVYDLSKLNEIQDSINLFRMLYRIPKHHCVADQDGLGSGVVDNCGIIGFVNNATPFREEAGEDYSKPQYNNLQSQCGYYLAKMINEHKIYLAADFTENEKEEIIEELGQLKNHKADQDGKVFLLPKKEIKENIGRSPDWRDVLLMRAYFDLDISDVELETEWN